MNKNDAKLASRRAVLRAGLAGGAAALTGPALAAGAESNPANLPPNVADWTRMLGEGVAARPYGKRAKYEEHIGRRDVSWLTASPQSSVSFTPLHEIDGIITPNGLCFERHHSGIAEVNPADYRLMIHGLVDKPLIFTLDDIKRMPRVNRAYFCECAANSGMEWRGAQLNGAQYTHGMVHCVMYTGVPLKVLLNEAGLKPKAKWLLMEGGDAAAMTRSLPLAKALDDALVAYRMNGEMLYPENGYPVRMVLPGWEANMWVKWLRRIEVGDQPWYTREETSKYTDLLANGQARRFTLLDGGEVRHHQSEPAGADQSQVGLHGAVGHRLVGPRQDRARRRLARRRPQLAAGEDRRAVRGTRRWRASTTSSTGTAASCCCNRAPWTRPATCSRARPSCARSAASIRSTTTTASRPGTCRRTARSRMSKCFL